MSEANKKTMARWFDELWNKGRLEVIDELTGDDVVAWGQAGHGEALKGSAAFRGYAESLHKSFSHIQMTVDDLISEDDKVVVRWTVQMVHTGDGLGFAPTCKQVEFSGITVAIIRDGKLVEGWDAWDKLGLLHQLGRIEDATPFLAKIAGVQAAR